MDGGLLSLKWNNHRSTFFYVLSNVRKKECYTDVTLACEGKFYPVHKLILSTCSEYFEQMFEQTQCKHPVIVLKDIRSEELESLLSYMYVGEVNVVQEKLSGLIKAAECLRIKGLAVPDEEPCTKSSSGSSREKRTSDNSISSEPKRRRQDDSGNFRQNVSSNSRGDDRRKSFDHQSSSSSNKYRNSSSNNITNNLRDGSRERGESDKNTSRERLLSQSSGTSNSNAQQTSDVKAEEPLESSEAEGPDEVTIDEPNEAVKQEPADLDAVYLSDSNSASESKDILMDNFGDGDGQQHFMDELLGQNSGSDQGHMGVGDFVEGGEGSSSAPSSQQQHMGRVSRQLQPLTTASSDTWSDFSAVEYLGVPRAAVSASTSFPPTSEIVSDTYNTPVPLPPFDELSPIAPSNPNMRHVCPVCGKEFYNKKDFRRHYMVHTGERPFPCPHCPYKARLVATLKIHLLMKHKR